MKKRLSKEQITGFPREPEAGMPAKELCREHGFSEASYHLWRSKFGGMNVPDAKRLTRKRGSAPVTRQPAAVQLPFSPLCFCAP